jgi:hypothetical protein
MEPHVKIAVVLIFAFVLNSIQEQTAKHVIY